MTNISAKNYFLLLTVFFLAFFSFIFSFETVEAQVPTPFGGQVIAITPCLHPFTGLHIQLGPPVGGSFLYQPGVSFSYPFGPPVRVGQWLLGMSAGSLLSCATKFDGYWQNFRSGGLIIFHGSSV